MRNPVLPAVLIASALLLPFSAGAQSAGALLDEARVALSAMKQSTAQVQQLANEARDTDKVKYSCVNESHQAMQQSLHLAEATVHAAKGWGIDVADAALKSVRGAQEQVNRHRAAANRCVGVDEAEGAMEVGQDSTIGTERAESAVHAEDADAVARLSGDEDGVDYDPFAAGSAPAAGSVPLSARAPAASPIK